MALLFNHLFDSIFDRSEKFFDLFGRRFESATFTDPLRAVRPGRDVFPAFRASEAAQV